MVAHVPPSSYTLRNLHEVPIPDPVSWWPQTAGWYFLMALVSAVLATLFIKFIHRWWLNRYRREALYVLKKLPEDGPNIGFQLYRLHKLVLNYLSPSNANYFGQHFLQHLNDYEPGNHFNYADSLGQAWLESLVDDKTLLTADQTKALIERAECWLRHHRYLKERGCSKT